MVQCSAWCHFGLSTADFLAELDDADVRLRFDNGVDLIQAFRPLPRKFRPDAVASRSQVWVHKSLSIYLQCHLPHSGEVAMVEATDRAVLQGWAGERPQEITLVLVLISVP
jgi:hypothetical protein